MKRALLFIWMLGILLLNSSLSVSEDNIDEDIVYKAQRKLESNVGLIQTVLEKYPDDAEIHRGAAELYNGIGLIVKKDPAIYEYRKAIELNPKDITYYTGLGMALWYKYKHDYTYEKTDDPSELIEALEVGEEKEPNNAFYDYMWASVYLMQGKEKEGIKKIEDALNKKYLKQHWQPRIKSKIKILEEMGCFTSTEIKINVPYGAGGTDEMLGKIISHLKKLGEGKESQGAWEGAAEIYKTMVKMAGQVRSDAWLLGTSHMSNYYAKTAYNGLLRCYKKLGMENEQYPIEQELKTLEDVMNKESAACDKGALLLSTLKGDELDKLLDEIIEKGEIKASGL